MFAAEDMLKKSGFTSALELLSLDRIENLL